MSMTTVVDHPFDAESFIMAFYECFAQFTQETGVAGTPIAEPEAQRRGGVAVYGCCRGVDGVVDLWFWLWE